MQDFFAVPEETLSKSLRVFRDIIRARGFKNAKFVRTNEVCIFATRPDGKEISFCFGTPPTTSYAAGRIADDKYICYLLLKDLPGVKQPETVLLSPSSSQSETAASNHLPDHSETEAIKSLLKKHPRIVLKPFDGAHGANVFTNITDYASAKSALATIREHSKTPLVLAQEMITSTQPEVRAICIDSQFVAAYARIPATVTGDGQHTVAELIDLENSTLRTAPYRSNLAYINKPAALAFLESQPGDPLHSIPASGEKVQVLGICNTGQGGTMEDITDTFPAELKELSSEIAKRLRLPVAGIDFFGEYVIEVNKAPALYHPVSGPGATICVEKFVDYLESL